MRRKRKTTNTQKMVNLSTIDIKTNTSIKDGESRTKEAVVMLTESKKENHKIETFGGRSTNNNNQNIANDEFIIDNEDSMANINGETDGGRPIDDNNINIDHFVVNGDDEIANGNHTNNVVLHEVDTMDGDFIVMGDEDKKRAF